MDNTKEITALQYSWYLGCRVQNVRKNLKHTGLKHLPDVIEVKYYSRFYLFVVPDSLKIPKKDPNPPIKYTYK